MTTPLLTRKARLAGPDGKTYLIGTNTDLTEIKKREDQYKALTETVPVGVMQLEEDGTISFSNPLLNAYCGGDGAGESKLEMIERIKAKHPEFPGKACKFETEIAGARRAAPQCHRHQFGLAVDRWREAFCHHQHC